MAGSGTGQVIHPYSRWHWPCVEAWVYSGECKQWIGCYFGQYCAHISGHPCPISNTSPLVFSPLCRWVPSSSKLGGTISCTRDIYSAVIQCASRPLCQKWHLQLLSTVGTLLGLPKAKPSAWGCGLSGWYFVPSGGTVVVQSPDFWTIYLMLLLVYCHSLAALIFGDMEIPGYNEVKGTPKGWQVKFWGWNYRYKVITLRSSLLLSWKSMDMLQFTRRRQLRWSALLVDILMWFIPLFGILVTDAS